MIYIYIQWDTWIWNHSVCIVQNYADHVASCRYTSITVR